jgi:hypothetical protein
MSFKLFIMAELSARCLISSSSPCREPSRHGGELKWIILQSVRKNVGTAKRR